MIRNSQSICTKDVISLFGVSEKAARRLLRDCIDGTNSRLLLKRPLTVPLWAFEEYFGRIETFRRSS